ncbi:MAG: sulfur carrier protein ThiS [Arcobacteraceae bacterium]|jgi:sulfur carrier protein|nr:sulfur carrier protein ThiS [Arcobacteraceae bacterium]
MKIIINGQEKDFALGITLKEVIQALQVEEKVMASAVNMDIVKKENWETYVLEENDKLELLEFVGGG